MAKHVTSQTTEVGADAAVRFTSPVRILSYIIVFTIVIFSVSYAALTRFEPQYRAQATILINAGEPASGESAAAGRSAAFNQELMASHMQLIRSRDLARGIAEQFDLARRPEFNPAPGEASVFSEFLVAVGLRRDPSRSSLDERLLEQFSRRLSVSQTGRPGVVAIAFRSFDPQLAAAVANALAEDYVALQQGAQPAVGGEPADRLATEIDGLRRRVEKIESDVAAYRERIDELTATSTAIPRPSRSVTEADGERLARAEARADLAELERAAAEQRLLLDSYQRRYREALARRQGAFQPVSARIVTRAAVPIEPDFPRPASLSAAIALVAFLIMLAFVVMRALAGRRPLPKAIPLPEVAEPGAGSGRSRWDDDIGVRRMMPGAPRVAAAAEGRAGEAVAAAAETIVAEGFKRIMVAAGEDAAHGDGLPLAGVALARAIAGADRRPVLIDLRDDAANRLSMGEGGALPGFSDLLAGEASFGQVIFRDRQSRVHYIPAGLRPLALAGPAGDRVRLIVSALDHTYDHVILDVGDQFAGTIAAECDAVVLVSGFGESDPRTARAVGRMRAGANARVILLPVAPPAADAFAADGEAA